MSRPPECSFFEHTFLCIINPDLNPYLVRSVRARMEILHKRKSPDLNSDSSIVESAHHWREKINADSLTGTNSHDQVTLSLTLPDT